MARNLITFGQSINDIRHMRDLAQALRDDAGKTRLRDYSQKLLKAAADLDICHNRTEFSLA